MEFFDTNKHLPPRKRLLAELKRDNSLSNFLPPVPFVSGTLGIQLRHVVNSPSSTPKEIIEVSQYVASAAAEIAVVARNNAIEKAAKATKAETAAKNALLFLNSITVDIKSRKGCLVKNKVRKKQVPIKLLYKTNHAAGRHETDDVLARQLHRAMNSSPRISDHRENSTDNFGKEVMHNGDVCIKNSHVLLEDSVRMNDECYGSVDNLEGKSAVCSNASDLEDGEENQYYIEKQQNESKYGSVAVGKKVRIRQKKLPLSQCNFRDQAEANKTPISTNRVSSTKEPKLDSEESNMTSDDTELSHDGGVSMNIAPAWKCKKIKEKEDSAAEARVYPSTLGPFFSSTGPTSLPEWIGALSAFSNKTKHWHPVQIKQLTAL